MGTSEQDKNIKLLQENQHLQQVYQNQVNQYLQLPLATTYFQLIQKVGSKGIYQRNMFILFSINWFLCGFLILQSGFLFMNKTFDCPNQGLLIVDCKQTICLLNQQRDQYLANLQVTSLATQFGPFLCEDQFSLNFLKTVEFIGVFLGYLVFFYFTDNYGRKFSLVMAWACTCFGVALLIFAQNIYMAVAGLFFAGAGSETSIKINMTALSEIVQNSRRQIYSVALQISFGFSGIIIALLYYSFHEWRLINAFFLGIPAVILLLIYIFYFEQTPLYLLKKQKTFALKSLNRIGEINCGRKDLISMQDIQNVLNQQKKIQKGNNKITMIDLFKYPSLRMVTFPNLMISLVISYLYITPSFVIDKLGLNPYLSLIIVAMSQLLAYPTSMFFVKSLKRAKSGFFCFGFSSILSLILVIFQKPIDCNGQCFQAYIQIICVFIGRFLISFYYAIFYVFLNELYPMKARGTGIGLGSAMGSVGSMSGNILIGYFYQQNINPQALNVIFGILAGLSFLFLPETLNQPLKNQIQQNIAQNHSKNQKEESKQI